jgi:hypothetical protein
MCIILLEVSGSVDVVVASGDLVVTCITGWKHEYVKMCDKQSGAFVVVCY